MADTKQQDSQPQSRNLWGGVRTVALTVAGAIGFMILLVIFQWSQFAFSVVINVFLLAIAVTVLVYLNQKASCFSEGEYTALTYISLYTIAIEVRLIVMAGALALWKRHGSGGGGGSSGSSSSGSKY
eukprot:jgi/Chrzof1/11493/UNPLg00425.t1